MIGRGGYIEGKGAGLELGWDDLGSRNGGSKGLVDHQIVGISDVS